MMAEAKQERYCDYCFEEEQTINATAFCGKCRKYLCGSCVKQHGKFLPDHKLNSGSEITNKEKGKAYIPCEIHIGQVAELFCEEHKDVFCNFCKIVKHKNCIVETIGEVVQGTNVQLQFETSVANLLALQEVMEKKQKENQHKLDTYSKTKQDMKNKVKSLQQELNEVFDAYSKQMDSTEQSVLENVNAKVQSYKGLLSNLEPKLKAKNAAIKETSGEELFLSVVEMNQLYDSYKQLVDTLEHGVADPESVALQDERLPSIIQRLLQISSLKEVGRVDVEVEKEPAATDNCHSKIMKDQSCQVNFLQDYSEAKTEGVCNFCNSQIHSCEKQVERALTTMDDAEHGSSDDVTEQTIINYQKVSFSDIKSCSLLNESIHDRKYDITDCCFMPDGQAVLCARSVGLMILDTEMKVKVRLHPQKSEHSPYAIDIMDSKNVIVALPAAKILQIISMIPTVKLGRKISLKYECRGLKYHNNKFFIYSENLYENWSFKYPGIQALDRNGEVLKTIPMFDYPGLFYFTRNGHIVYSYTRQSRRQIKCITQDNTDIFSYPVSGDVSIIIPDDDGNVIICETNSKVRVIKSDGTPGKILFEEKDSNDSCYKSLRSMYYNRHNNTILVLTDEEYYDRCRESFQTEAILRVYKIEM